MVVRRITIYTNSVQIRHHAIIWITVQVPQNNWNWSLGEVLDAEIQYLKPGYHNYTDTTLNPPKKRVVILSDANSIASPSKSIPSFNICRETLAKNLKSARKSITVTDVPYTPPKRIPTLSQHDVAKILNIKQVIISRIEHGAPISHENVILLSSLYQIPVQNLYKKDLKMEPKTISWNQLIENYRRNLSQILS